MARQVHDTPEDAVIFLTTGTVPERRDDIKALWERYNPDLVVVTDAKRVTLNADKHRIQFDAYDGSRFSMKPPRQTEMMAPRIPR
jgi:hypothetical protein